MTAYKDVDAINRFINVTPNDWEIFIHIDKKSKLKIERISERAHVYKLKNIYWGAWEHLYVVLELMRRALDLNGQCIYFHIVTGQDFYAMPPKEIEPTQSLSHRFPYSSPVRGIVFFLS